MFSCTTLPPAIRHNNLAYLQDGHERQSGDLWLPQGEGPWPVIVMVHGGGRTRRDRRDMDSRAEWFSAGVFPCLISITASPRSTASRRN